MELFAGSARLTSSLGGEGFDSFGVDHVVAKQASGSILQLDLNDPLSVEHLWKILADPAVRYIHCAPPCGTATRARDIQFPGAPAVLRAEAKPQGIEGLEGINAVRVAKANALYSLVLSICKFCLQHHKYFSCEHPSRSYLWLLPEWKEFMNQSDVRQTFFHHCEYGGDRRKGTRLLHNIPKYDNLHRLCSGRHVHAGRGRIKNRWATSFETAYPWGLCKVMASLLKEHFLSLGCKPPPKQLSEVDSTIPGARAFSGLQSRKRAAPLISEFASVHSVILPMHLATKFLTPGYKLPSDWAVGKSVSCSPAIASFPAGSRVLRAHVIQGEQEGPAEVGNSKGYSGLDPIDPLSGLDPLDKEVRQAMQSGDPESVAALINRTSRVEAKDLSMLLDLLPSENLRWTGQSGSAAKSFQAGSFVHGGVRGVRSCTGKFPESTKALCAYVRQTFPGFTFGTVGLFRNVCAVPHRDSNNEACTDNAIAALSSFKGGGLWMEDPSGDTPMDFKGKTVLGVGVPVGKGGFRFDGRRLHATLPWSGQRDVVVAYMARGPELLSSVDQVFLRKLGFPLSKDDILRSPPPGKGRVKVVIGVYRTPDQFVAEAMKVGHPSLLSVLLPPELLEAVQAIHRQGEGDVAKERTATLRKWLRWVSELSPAEDELKAGMPDFRREVLSSKRLLVFRRMLADIQHEDLSLVDNMAKGLDLTGTLPRSHVFMSKFKPAEQSEAQLRRGAKRLRDGLIATVKPARDPVVDKGVLDATRKEVARGFVIGPVPPGEVPAGASLTHRFGVIQGHSEGGPKVRPIDNYLSSQVNATITQVESVPVHSVDVVAGMLGAWLNEWFCAGRKAEGAPKCKAWDLRAAYKQLPLSDSSFELDSHFVIYNAEKGSSEIYKQKVLPFGSKASVSGFIRCAFALWRVGVKSLKLVWTDYFDDYLSTSGTACTRHTDFVISMFFRILGWDLSLDKNLDYDTMCVILGVQLNLKDAMLGVAVIGNTEKRKAEAIQEINAALETNELDPKLSERLRGRLQFASCQVFGRRPKAALKLLAAHGRQRKWELSECARHALLQLKQFLSCGKPRPIRARKDSFVHIYVDAAFEPEGHSGLGGVVFGPGGQALGWFGYKLDHATLSRLLKGRDKVRETVIFELEALALAISLRAFSPFVERRGAVIFTDNDGVLGSFIRGHSENDVCSRLIEFFGQCEEELENTCWMDRVPSSSNPSDAPSRGERVPGVPEVQVCAQLLREALPGFFG